ncbi:MAG: sulfatase [Rhodopirellula sp.]|nr:sulfatase [Rhodopirellula sp.]
MRGNRTPLWLVFVTASIVFPCSSMQGAVAAPPNVVLFLVDDMGWMDSGAYGSQYYQTPNIDRLAKRGMLFTDAYSANPLCSPTRASILTGKFPARLGLTTAAGHLPPQPNDAPRYADKTPPERPILMPESLHYLPASEYTLAEALRDAGYRTGHFGKWHLGLTEPHWPEQQGYDVAWHGKPDPGPPGPNGYFSPYSFKAGTITPGPEGEYIVDRLTDEAIRFIEANRRRPFFTSVWQYGVHGPWDHKEEYTRQFVGKKDPRGQQGNPVMASMLKSVDESLGRIVAKLEELNLSERTLILFTSDNGGNVHSNVRDDRRKDNVKPGHPQWRSVSSYRKYAGYLPPTNNSPLRAGKGTLYEGGVRVPLIVAWPKEIPAGARSSEIVATIDFYPTILDLLGLPKPAAVQFDGISFASLLRNPSTALDRQTMFNFFPHGGPTRPAGVTVRRGPWKLIRWYETGPDNRTLHELYNLQDDLGETKNLAAEQSELVKELDRLIDQFLADTGALVPKPNPAYDPRQAMLLGWVPKFCQAEVRGDALEVIGNGRMPFIANVRFSASGPLEVRLRLRSDSAGEGRVQWRGKNQQEFPATGQTSPFPLQGGNWQEVCVPVAENGPLAHLRIWLPASGNPIQIDWVELSRTGVEEPIERWDFREVR